MAGAAALGERVEDALRLRGVVQIERNLKALRALAAARRDIVTREGRVTDLERGVRDL